MPDSEYEAICQRIWTLYQQTHTLAVAGNGRRNLLFPPPRRNKPVDLLVVGISPNQAAPVNYTHSFDGLKDFARSFEYVSGGGGVMGQHYDTYYRDILRFLRRADERFGVWWEVENKKCELLLEFTDALHIATQRGNDDIEQFISLRAEGGLERRRACKEILSLELQYYQPKTIIGNGRLASDLLWEICTGQSVTAHPKDCMTRYQPCNSVVHLSGFFTSNSMDAYSRTRLLNDIRRHLSR
jgi:hypothetical protein